jgi:lysophospholipase L1-like esterase
MKKISFFLLLLLGGSCLVFGQSSKLKFVDASTLNLIGKIAPTPQLYHRVDTARYRDFTPSQNTLVNESAGLALCFHTNSSRIAVKAYFHWKANNVNMSAINMSGFDLYIKRQGEWLYAASNAGQENGKALNLISHIGNAEKECLLYLPSFSIIDSLKIGIDEEARIESSPNPFRHRIIIFGSSFTHGTCANRPGMSYPLIIERSSGLYIMNLGVSGNSKLQQSFAQVLADAKADAFVFDAFSNPSAEEIEHNFAPFVQTIRKSHPTTPLIFVQTIYRERRNFDEECDKFEQAKMEMGAKVVKEAMAKDKNIYFIDIKDMTGNDHLTSTDGIHPSALGYYRWAEHLQPALLKILSKYGIK